VSPVRLLVVVDQNLANFFCDVEKVSRLLHNRGPTKPDCQKSWPLQCTIGLKWSIFALWKLKQKMQATCLI
jgi:hypothetical protein